MDYAFFQDGAARSFAIPGTLTMLCAGLILKKNLKQISSVKIHYRHAMLFVSLTWIICSVDSAIPIYLIENISFTDSVFEATSALTTTGATVLTNLDAKAPTLLMYRQFLQWLGGLGVVIFVVAIVPMLNVGGMRVFQAETPGPMKGDKLSPRIAKSARALWIVYCWLTLSCALGYWLAGMNLFDAVAHSFSTVSTGGFSTHDASIGFFNSLAIELNANIFMLLGAMSFGLHYRLLFRRQAASYFHDEEARVFVITIIVLTLLVAIVIIPETASATEKARAVSRAFFHVISFITSTGFGAGNFTEWPATAVLLLIIAGYIGGCSGSTAGGNKIVRDIIAIKIWLVQLKRLAHPRGLFVIKYNKTPIDEGIRDATMAFLLLSIVLSALFTLVLMASGLDFLTSFSAVSSCLNVLGPAFGELANNFIPLSDFSTWTLTFSMLLGRLEFFTLLVLFSPTFWRS